jgi:tetratricopeptide (TPR) repeat protein
MRNIHAERLLDAVNGHLKKRDFANATELVDRALAIEPKNGRALSYSAFIAGNADKKELALKLIEQALKLDPDRLAVIYHAAHVFFICGQPDRARPYWERLSEMLPRSVESCDHLSRPRGYRSRRETSSQGDGT